MLRMYRYGELNLVVAKMHGPWAMDHRFSRSGSLMGSTTRGTCVPLGRWGHGDRRSWEVGGESLRWGDLGMMACVAVLLKGRESRGGHGFIEEEG